LIKIKAASRQPLVGVDWKARTVYPFRNVNAMRQGR
jgi:hypothetical protein